jgi:hypothetical protein
MDLLISLSHVLAYLVLAFAIAIPQFRRPAAAIMAVVAVLTAITAMTGDSPRTLETVHTYAGFEGSAMEVSMVSFPTGSFTAEGWLWAMPFASFAAMWIIVLLTLKERTVKSPWILPLLFAWTGMATWLGEQAYAAPSMLVQPIGIDRFLWPAGLALCLVASKSAKSLIGVLVMIAAGITLGRLPAAFFSQFASSNALGTCLDIHTIRDIVNPMTQMQFEPRLEVGSGEQEFWLIWLEHVIFYPAVYLMSLFGIGFGTYMFHKHSDTPA